MQMTKTHILDQAERLFADRGFHGASTRLIAVRADANLALITYYFKSKRGLFGAVVERRMVALADRLRQAVDGLEDPAHQLRRFVDTLVQFLAGEHPHFACLLVREAGPIRDGVGELSPARQALRQFRDQLHRILGAGRASRRFRYVDADLFIVTMLGTIGLATASISDGGTTSAELSRRLNDYLSELRERLLSQTTVAGAKSAPTPAAEIELMPAEESLVDPPVMTIGEID